MPRDFFVSFFFVLFCVQSLASNSQFVAASEGAHTFFEPVPAEGPMCEEGVMVSVTVPYALSEMPRDALQQSLQSQVFFCFILFYFYGAGCVVGDAARCAAVIVVPGLQVSPGERTHSSKRTHSSERTHSSQNTVYTYEPDRREVYTYIGKTRNLG